MALSWNVSSEVTFMLAHMPIGPIIFLGQFSIAAQTYILAEIGWYAKSVSITHMIIRL